MVVSTYSDDIVGVCAMEVWYSYAGWKRLLTVESLVKAFTKLWLDAQRLQYKDAHSNKTLLRGIITLVDGVVEHQNDKIMGPVCVNDERSEALVALQSFPEQHDHLWGPC